MIESTFLFLKGIGETTERKLWTHGVETWTCFLSADSLPGISRDRKRLYDKDVAAAADRLKSCDGRFFALCLRPLDHWR